MSSQVDSKLLDLLIKSLVELRGGVEPEKQKDDKKKQTRGAKPSTSTNINDIDSSDINSILNALLTAVTATLDTLKEQKVEQGRQMKELQEEVRYQGDEIDEVKQRSMKGNLILSSPSGQQGKSSIIKPLDQLNKESSTVTKHVTDLLKLKYNVDIPANDIQACHHLPNKSIVVRIWNRAPGSAWNRLVEEVKKGGKKEINVYANFQLTNKRNNIMYHLRTLKKEGKINKLYSNENGQISFKVKEQSSKVKVTYFSVNKLDLPKTLTISEINSYVC